MSLDSAGASNRINPNRWSSSGNKGTQFTGPQEAEEAQGNNRNISAPARSGATEAPGKIAPEAAPQQPTQAKEAAKPISRALNGRDISNQLLQLGLPVTKENKQLMLTMIQHGVEASEENFLMAKRLQGKSKQANTIESAVVAMSKGLQSNPKSVDMLAKFLNKSHPLTKQLNQLSGGLATFQSALLNQESLMSKGLITGLSALVSDLDDMLKKLSKRYTDKSYQLTPIDRESLINNFKTFYAFLSGLKDKLKSGEKEPPFLKNLNTLQGQISDFMDALLPQAILSTDPEKSSMSINEKFAYWQLPNPLQKTQNEMDILIRKDPGKKKRQIDPKKTRMVVRLDTPDLGEMAITLDVQDQKLWVQFQVENGETEGHVATLKGDLLNRMAAINYKVMTVKSSRKKIDLKKMLLPTFNLDNLSRVSAEI